MDRPRYDEGQWPIVLVTLPAAELNDTDWALHLDRLSAFSKRGVPYAQIIDVRASSSVSAPARRLIAERLDQDEDAYPGVLRGVAVVLATPVHRGIFKAISWLSTKTRSFEQFLDPADALVWARRLVAVPADSLTISIAPDVSGSRVTKQVG